MPWACPVLVSIFLLATYVLIPTLGTKHPMRGYGVGCKDPPSLARHTELRKPQFALGCVGGVAMAMWPAIEIMVVGTKTFVSVRISNVQSLMIEYMK